MNGITNFTGTEVNNINNIIIVFAYTKPVNSLISDKRDILFDKIQLERCMHLYFILQTSG